MTAARNARAANAPPRRGLRAFVGGFVSSAARDDTVAAPQVLMYVELETYSCVAVDVGRSLVPSLWSQ